MKTKQEALEALKKEFDRFSGKELEEIKKDEFVFEAIKLDIQIDIRDVLIRIADQLNHWNTSDGSLSVRNYGD